jgi:mortality factor 4-like protein 1
MNQIFIVMGLLTAPTDLFSSDNEEVLSEVVRGIKLYFDKTIGNMLLYRLERKQYAKTVETHPETAPSDIYGAEHLLRLFGKTPKYFITNHKLLTLSG